MSEEVLTRAKDRFSKSEDSESDNRNAALDDLKFARMGEQWSDSDKKKREIEGRPALVYNKLPSFIRQVVNDARLNKPSITVI